MGGTNVRDKKRGLLSSDNINNSVKRNRVCYANLVDTLELKLLLIDGNLDELNSKIQSCDSVSKKRDDVPIPIVYWLYWINGGMYRDIIPKDWNTFVDVLQERLLLVWWKYNLIRSFNKWLKRKN